MITRGLGQHSESLLITRGLGMTAPFVYSNDYYCLRSFNESPYIMMDRGSG